MQFQSPFLQTGDQTTRPLVRFIQVHVVQRQANTQVSMTLTASSLTGSSSAGLNESLAESRLNLHRVGDDRRASATGSSQGIRVHRPRAAPLQARSPSLVLLCRLNGKAPKSKAGTSSNAGSSSKHSRLFRQWRLFHHRSSRHVCIQERKVRQTQIDGLSTPGSTAAFKHRRVSAGATDGSDSVRAEVNSAKSISSVTAPAHGLRGRGVRHKTRFCPPSGISVDWKSSCSTSSEMSITSASSIEPERLAPHTLPLQAL